MTTHYAYIAVIMAFLGFVSPLFAQNEDVFTAKIDRPHLYSVTKKGTPRSYLFGTYHYGLSTNQLPSWVLAAMDEAQIHAYEMPSKDKETIESSIATVREVFENPGGLIIKVEASRKSNSPEVISRLITMGVPPELAPLISEEAETESWNACSFILFVDLIRSGHVLDFEMELRSHLTRKKILALDTLKLRDEARDSTKSAETSSKDSCNVREYSLYEVLSIRTYLVELLQDYLKGEVSMDKPKASVIHRNRAWVRSLSRRLKSNSVFVAVGAGHLYGDDGLIDLLRRQGFTVERVTAPDAASASNAP